MNESTPVAAHAAVAAEPRHRPLLMLFIAFLAQNMAVGMTFAAIGVLMTPLGQDLQGSRSLLSLTIALLVLTSGLLGPFTGTLLDRWSLRGTLAIGCALVALGFVIAARSQSTLGFVLGFGAVAGVGLSMAGTRSANKIVVVWFRERIGAASGIVNVSLLNPVGPPLYAMFIASYGWRALLDLFALLFIALLGLCLLVRTPVGTAPAALRTTTADHDDNRSLLRNGLFWSLALSYGLLTASGIASTIHLVPHAEGLGYTPQQAALLLTVLGVCAILGNFLFGWLCDWLSPRQSLLINAAVQGVSWLVLALDQSLPGLVLAAAGIGLGSSGVVPIFIALMSRSYRASEFGRVFGLMGLVALPFVIAAAPLAGLLYDLSGDYAPAFAVQAVLCAVPLLALLRVRSHA